MKQGYRERPIIGGDTETIDGEPYTFQLWDYPDGANKRLVYVNKRNVFRIFLETLYQYPDQSIVYFHNLGYDLPILFYPFLLAFRDNRFNLSSDDYDKKKRTGLFIDVLFGKVNHADIWLQDKFYQLVDTFAYFKTSLAKLAKTFGVSEKMQAPDGLGTKRYEGKQRDYFERYAIQDARVPAEIGYHIQQYHKTYDVKNSLSGPQLSAFIWKRHFVPEDTLLAANPPDVEEAAVLSYHGGKNGLYVEPGVYENVYLYDINSAYPFAMVNVPNFLGASYDWLPAPKGYEQEGIYCISGFSIPSYYNPLRDHSFGMVSGPFRDIWVTSYELRTLLRHKFLREFSCKEAFVVIPDQHSENPLKRFAQYFYQKKSEETGQLREFYKIMLNSLYGKFIQSTRNEEDEELEDIEYRAGGLWNPLLASLITGFVRAHLTELEIKYQSLHSSTDSIMTHSKRVPTSKAMGDLSLKAFGSALLIRPKFYLLWNEERELLATATHGYHGDLETLLKMLRTGKRDYEHNHMYKVREAFVQKVKPLVMVRLSKSISIPISEPLRLPKLKTIIGGRNVLI